MTHEENVERVRQMIMRFRELLDITRQQLDASDRAYEALFASLDPEQTKGLREKEIQRLLAQQMIHDLTPLSVAVGNTRFELREMERAFVELYDIILTPHPEDEETE
jgi:hypothetical protein